MICSFNTISWGTSAVALVAWFLDVSASRFPLEPQDLATAAHEGHLRQAAASVSGRERLPSLLGDGGDRAPNHDLKEEKTRLKGQAEEEQEEAGSGREAAHLSGVTAAGRALSGRQEEGTESRGGRLDSFNSVKTDIRRLTTSSAGQADIYPNCTSFEFADGTAIGDNYCDSIFNSAECGYDEGDCCECDCGLQLESSSSNFTCGVNGFICVDPASDCFEDLYPDCESRGGTLEWVGNGACYVGNNNEACGYDGGDCCECDCVGNLENRCGVNGYDCADPLSPSECPEEVPTPSPSARPLITSSPVDITSSPANITPSVASEGGGDDGSDNGIVIEIIIGVASTVVGGVVLGLVTKHCLGERAPSASSAG